MKLLINASSQPSEYTEYHTQTHGHIEYGVHIGNSDSADFFAQMTKIAPYDDADYVWAKILPNKKVEFIKNGRVIDRAQLPEFEDDDYEDVTEYIDMCLDTVLLELEEYNKSISSIMMYD